MPEQTSADLVADAKERAEIAKAYAEAAAANADAEAKRIANEQARQTLESDRLDKLASRLSASVPDVSSLTPSSVAFSDGKALRRGEALSDAYRDVARDITSAVVPHLGADGTLVYLTSNGSILATALGYRWLLAEATNLGLQLETATEAAARAIQPQSTPPSREILSTGAGPLELAGAVLSGPISAVGAVVAKAATQIASLFELKVAVADSEVDVPNLTMQAVVAGALLATKPPNVKVILESQRVPGADSPAIAAALALVVAVANGTRQSLQLDEEIAQAGPDADKLVAEQRDLDGAIATASAFLERVTTVPEGGLCPLALAVAAEPFVNHPEVPVLFVGPARAETNQVTITRRLFAPRLQTGVNVAADYFLIKGESVVAAGHAVGAGGYHGKVTRWGTKWHASSPTS